MARIVFELEIAASPTALVEALTTADGIAGWWTDDVKFDGGVGATMLLGFPIAPEPFKVRLESTGADKVEWRSVGTFPPHWVDTTITWTFTPRGDANTLHFNHDGWASDEGPLPMSAYTWGQLLTTLKNHVEHGTVAPLFTR